MNGDFEDAVNRQRWAESEASATRAQQAAAWHARLTQSRSQLNDAAKAFATHMGRLHVGAQFVIECTTGDREFRYGFLGQKTKQLRVSIFVKSLGDGWIVTNPSATSEYGEPYGKWVVLRSGAIINVGHGGADLFRVHRIEGMPKPFSSGRGRDVFGLPTEVHTSNCVGVDYLYKGKDQLDRGVAVSASHVIEQLAAAIVRIETGGEL